MSFQREGVKGRADIAAPVAGGSYDQATLIPFGDRLVWQERRSAALEGPLTRLWKIASVNALDPSQLCRLLFRKSLIGVDAAGIHGRSLLITRWMSQIGDRGIELELQSAGLDGYAGRWTGLIATDQRLRYCKTCLALGYQSIFCQISGLQRCPVHGDALIDHCTCCGAPTPRYALTRTTMATPFCCPHCSNPLCGVGTPVSALSFPVLNRSMGDGYGQIRTWLRALRRLDISWPWVNEWQVPNMGKSATEGRQIAVFWVLTRLVASGLPEECIGTPAIRVAHFSAPPPRVLGSENLQVSCRGMGPDEQRARTAVYKLIERAFAGIIRRHHRRCLYQCAKAVRIEWGNELALSHGPVCPVVLGYLLWRHHFEDQVLIGRSGLITARRMRDSALIWPADLNVTTPIWGEFVLMSLIAYVQIGIEWCERAATLDQSKEVTVTPQLLELLNSFREDFSPRSLAWCSRVTYLRLAGRLAKGAQHFVIAGPQINFSAAPTKTYASRFVN